MKTVLVADDNDQIRAIMQRRLLRSGYRVLLATNGQEAVDVARAESPSIILLDMTMPVMDGWTAARQLRADPLTRAIPIIAFTAHAMPADRDGALAAGCDDQISKPFDYEDLLRRVEALSEGGKPTGGPAMNDRG